MTASSAPAAPATSAGKSASPGQRLARRHWPWLVGLVGGLVLLGPALRGGSLLNIDLVLTPTRPLPSGLWGLGPALPQRVPASIPEGLLGLIIGAPAAGKLVMVLLLAAAGAGAARLVGTRAPALVRLGAAALYALGPYALTRTAVGHGNVMVLVAVLPWALPTLVRPSEDLWATFLAALGLSLAGSPGGATAAVVLAVGLVAERGRRAWAVALVFLGSTVVWLGPSLAVLAAGAGVSGSGDFPTQAGGVAGWVRILVGGGFWQPTSDLGATGWWVTLAALGLTALAAYGHRELPVAWRNRALAVALLGLAMTVATALPGVRSAYGWFTATAVGAPFRESQRQLVLWLVWWAPAAAAGSGRLARRLRASAEEPGTSAGRAGWVGGLATVVVVVPTVAALAIAAPARWGAGGRLDPVTYPAGWAQARQVVHDHPGTVLGLPWKEYLDLSFAGGRRVLNPIADYLGTDVISSHDPEFGQPVQEQVDQRADRIDALMPDLLAGRSVAARLRALGVRWVMVIHESTPLQAGIPPPPVAGRNDWFRYSAALERDPGLRKVVDGGAPGRDANGGKVDLFEVRGWSGPVTAPRRAAPPAGHSYGETGVLPILRSTGAPAGSVWGRAGAPGWLRGLTPAEVTGEGTLRLEGGSGPIWFWPGFLLLAADGILAVAVVAAVLHLRRRRGGGDAERVDPDHSVQ